MSVTYLPLFYEYSVQHRPVPFAALSVLIKVAFTQDNTCFNRDSLWSQKGVTGQRSNSCWIAGLMFNIVYGSKVKNFRSVTTLWLISLKPVSTRLRTISLNINSIALLNVNNQPDGEINTEESKTAWLSVQCKHHRFKLLKWKWSAITLNGSGYLSLQKHICSIPFFFLLPSLKCVRWFRKSPPISDSPKPYKQYNFTFFSPIPVEMFPIHYYPSTQKWINVITM